MRHNVHSAQVASINDAWSWEDLQPMAKQMEPPTGKKVGRRKEQLEMDQMREAALGSAANRATPGGRLREVRLAANFTTAADAARAMGVSPITFQHHENGTRSITKRTAEVYGNYFHISPVVLLHGAAAFGSRQVPLVGAVTAGGQVINRDHPELSGPLPDHVSAPPVSSGALLSIVVVSNQLYPAYRAGDLIFYAPPSAKIADDVAGTECVVEIVNGGRVVCVPHKAAVTDTWTLTTYGAPPQAGIKLKSASPVLWVQRGGFKLPNPS